MTRCKITAVIPARGGSKGVPRKNIRDLHGFPLIAYSIAACRLSKCIGKIFVSTDDLEIAKVSEEYGAIIPYIRPPKYSTDSAKDYGVLSHFFDNVGVEEVVFIRPTTPLRSPEFLDNVIENYFYNKDRLSSIRSVHEMPESPYKVFKLENGYCKGFFEDYNGVKDYTNLPRQMFPKAYHPNGYIDIVKKSTILEGSTYGERTSPAITDFVTEVDLEYQFKILENELVDGNILKTYLKELNIA